MLDTQPDSRSERRDYLRPGCDVAGADMVGVCRETAPGADERRLRAAVRLVDVAAFGTRSTRIAWVHGDKDDAGERGLVAEKRTQLEERPRVQRRALGRANRYPIANAAEVFHSDPASGVFGLANDRLAENVIGVRVEIPLPPSELSEMALGTPGAGRLETGTELGETRTNSKSVLAGVGFSVRVDGQVADAEVDPEPTFRINGRPVRDVNGHEEKELALAVDEVGLSAHSFESATVVRANGARNDDATVECEQAHAVQAVLERVDPLVVRDGAERLELAEFRLVAPVDLADLRDGAHGVLRGQTEAVAELALEGAREADLVGPLRLAGALSQPRAGFVHAPHGGEQSLSILGRDEQLHGRDELHVYRCSMAITKHKETALPPRPEGRGFRAGER